MIREYPKPLLFLLCLVSFAAAVSAQSVMDGFASGEGAFWVGLVEKPITRKRSSFDLGTFYLDGESLTWQGENGTFTSLDHFYVYRERPNLTPAEKASIIEQYKKLVLKQFADLNIATSEVPFQFAGIKGVEIRGVAARKLVVRLFFSGSRLISFSNVRASTNFEEQTTLLNTFRVLTKEERIAAMIAESTPEHFPASSRDPRWLNDLRVAGIKGNVRRIFTDHQESPKARRTPWSDERYDRNGDVEFEIGYMGEYPGDITTRGWIDGKRVVRSRSVTFRLGEPGPNEKQITMIVEAAQPPSEEELKNRDPRFDSRYERSYDIEGRIVSEKMIGNQGRTYSVKTFTWPIGQKVSVSRNGRGEFFNKTKELIGDDGQVTEELSCDEAEKDCDATVFKYENDQKGNWIVKRSFEKKSLKGKISLKPNGTLYRKIVYYD